MLDAERGLRHRAHAHNLFGRGRLAQHALGLAGGAGRVGQRITHLTRRALISVRTRQPLLVFARPRGHAGLYVGQPERGADGWRRLDHDHMYARRHAAIDLVQEVGMHDQRLGVAVAQDEAGFFRFVVPVDRAGVRAGQARDQHRFEERDVVAQHDRHHVAIAQAEREQAADAA